MQILKTNGIERQFPHGIPQTLTELLKQMNIHQVTIVAEIDGHIIKQHNFPHTILINDRRIELVRFVGEVEDYLEDMARLALAEHVHYLAKHYWQSHISSSFSSLRPDYNVQDSHFIRFSDKNLVQMITALRLCFTDAGLVLPTSNCAYLRDHLIKLGITKVSAGSKTNPGGYSSRNATTEQFKINDDRSQTRNKKTGL